MPKKKGSTYKYTKQILKLAKYDGMTHKDIALKAGISEKSLSQVNKWINGTASASERQMQYFINTYGSALKRKVEHLFYTHVQRIEINESLILLLKKLNISQEFRYQGTSENPENSYTYDLIELDDKQKQKLLGLMLSNESSISLLENIKRHNNRDNNDLIYELKFRPKFIKLNGEVIFKNTLTYSKVTSYKTSKISFKRIILLRNEFKFHLIVQSRIHHSHSHSSDLIHSQNEDAIWDSEVFTNLDLNSALNEIDKFANLLHFDHRDGLNDNAITIPFIARQALIKNGIQVQDVIDLSNDGAIITEPQ